MDHQKTYAAASIKTADNLKTIAHSVAMNGLSHLSLPKIDEITNLVGQIIPAGNVPGVILSGLARLPERPPHIKSSSATWACCSRGLKRC